MPAREGVLLIGGSGFLGLALARALARSGREVHVLSRNTKPGKAEGIIFHRGSQDDPAVTLPLLARCRTVVHLASTSTPGSSARHPTLDTEEDLIPAARLAALMSDSPPGRLIFVSSGGAIYGNPSQLPVDELCTLQPLSYHAAGKVALESLFNAFAHANRVSLAIIRPSNLYGPGQSLRTGFGLVRTLLDRALRDQPVELWGDGSTVRDYLYIEDAVQACLRLIDAPLATGPFNAGSGTGTTIRELIAHIETVTGRNLAVVGRPARTTDVHAIVLDSTRLREATGWTTRTDLLLGLRQTWQWIRTESA